MDTDGGNPVDEQAFASELIASLETWPVSLSGLLGFPSPRGTPQFGPLYFRTAPRRVGKVHRPLAHCPSKGDRKDGLEVSES